jgi:hypothetical protein
MGVFLTQENIILATGIALVFALGALTHRWLTARRENVLIDELTHQVERLERQRDSAHKVSLELAATHNKLVGEQLEAEWTIHSLKSDLRVRDERIKKLLEASSPGPAAVKTDVWNVEEARFQ